LRGIHGTIGVGQQCFEIGSIGREAGDSDAGPDSQGLALVLDGSGNQADQGLCQIGNCLGKGLALEHHGELVTAQSGDCIGTADGGAEPPRHFLKNVVSRVVAVRIVDDLEVVKIDQEKISFAVLQQGESNGKGQLFLQYDAVAQTGQWLYADDLQQGLLIVAQLFYDRGQLHHQVGVGIHQVSKLVIMTVVENGCRHLIPDLATDRIAKSAYRRAHDLTEGD